MSHRTTPPEFNNTLSLFAGNSNKALAKHVSNILRIPLRNMEVKRFSDGEIGVEINECVRGTTAFVIQSTSMPVNDNIMELLLIADALRRSNVKKIIAVIPYYGYSRQDRRPGFSRTPITSKVVADMIAASGISRLITVDIHSLQQEGFFSIPFTNIPASITISADIWRHYGDILHNVSIVSPDVGGVRRARNTAKQLTDNPLVIVDKRRPAAGEAAVMNIIGDVENRDCILIDDLIDSAGTLCKAAAALKEHGAKTVVAYATHPVFSGAAIDRLNDSVIDEIVVTDTINLDNISTGKIRQISIANLIAETITRIKTNRSVSQLYMDEE